MAAFRDFSNWQKKLLTYGQVVFFFFFSFFPNWDGADLKNASIPPVLRVLWNVVIRIFCSLVSFV